MSELKSILTAMPMLNWSNSGISPLGEMVGVFLIHLEFPIVCLTAAACASIVVAVCPFMASRFAWWINFVYTSSNPGTGLLPSRF